MDPNPNPNPSDLNSNKKRKFEGKSNCDSVSNSKSEAAPLAEISMPDASASFSSSSSSSPSSSSSSSSSSSTDLPPHSRPDADSDPNSDPNLTHIHFDPKPLSDFNIRLGDTVFHLHKLKLYETSGYFKALFDAAPDEYDVKKNGGRIPILELPASFLEGSDDSVTVLQWVLEMAYDEKKEVEWGKPPVLNNWVSFSDVCFVIHYFDMKSVERRVSEAWLEEVPTFHGKAALSLGWTIRLSKRYHFDTLYQAAVRGFKKRYPSLGDGAEDVKDIKAMVDRVDDLACLRDFLVDLYRR